MADPTPHSPLPPHTPRHQSQNSLPSSTPNNIHPSSFISPADCFRLGQISLLIQSSPNQGNIPLFPPGPVIKKRRGRPSKAISTPVTNSTAEPDADTSSSVPADNANPGASSQSYQPVDSTTNCWFTPREDGKFDMDVAANWFSVFANFTEWRTIPKTLVGDKLAAYLVSKNHPKRERRECQKKVCILFVYPGQLLTGMIYRTYRSNSLKTGSKRLRPFVIQRVKAP